MWDGGGCTSWDGGDMKLRTEWTVTGWIGEGIIDARVGQDSHFSSVLT